MWFLYLGRSRWATGQFPRSFMGEEWSPNNGLRWCIEGRDGLLDMFYVKCQIMFLFVIAKMYYVSLCIIARRVF